MMMVAYCLPWVFQKLAFFHRSLRASLPKREKPAFDNFPYLVTREKHTKWHTVSTNFVVSNSKITRLCWLRFSNSSEPRWLASSNTPGIFL
jgi:hypothetical protein